MLYLTVMNIDWLASVARAEIWFVTKSVNDDIENDLSGKKSQNAVMKNCNRSRATRHQNCFQLTMGTLMQKPIKKLNIKSDKFWSSDKRETRTKGFENFFPCTSKTNNANKFCLCNENYKSINLIVHTCFSLFKWKLIDARVAKKKKFAAISSVMKRILWHQKYRWKLPTHLISIHHITKPKSSLSVIG